VSLKKSSTRAIAMDQPVLGSIGGALMIGTRAPGRSGGPGRRKGAVPWQSRTFTHPPLRISGTQALDPIVRVAAPSRIQVSFIARCHTDDSLGAWIGPRGDLSTRWNRSLIISEATQQEDL
jgi:hypothetical protein